jgi:hypothetical protein
MRTTVRPDAASAECHRYVEKVGDEGIGCLTGIEHPMCVLGRW